MKPTSLFLASSLVLLTIAPAASAADPVAPTLVEAQPAPTGDEFDREWVEFANPTPVPLDLDGLYLTDHDGCFAAGEGFVEEYRWPLNATVPALSHLVLRLPTDCLNLANAGDDLALEDEDGREIQSLAYGDAGSLPAPGDGESLAACSTPAGLHGGWSVASQTPGEENPRCSPAT